VRGAAVWALGRIAEPRLAAAAAEACLPGESDTDVRTEWLRLLAPVEYSRAP